MGESLKNLRNVHIDLVKLKKARGIHDLTYVAKVIGVSKQSLWNYENGVCRVPDFVLARLCLLYQVELSSLITTAPKKNLQRESKIA